MKRLHWYIIKSFIGPFFMTFFIVLFVLLMQFLWKYVDDMVGKGLELKILAKMMFYASFAMIPYAFPLAMLLASIMAFGNLGENYELVAIKSSGVSLIRIMKPLVVIALLITSVAFYFANNILPVTNLKFTTLLYSVRQQNPEVVLHEGIFMNDIDGYSVKVGRKSKDSDMLYDLLIYDHTTGLDNRSVTIADSGYIQMTDDKKYMVFELYDGSSYSEENSSGSSNPENFPFRRDKFKNQRILVQVENFDFTLSDENFFKKAQRMLNLKQLIEAKDSLNIKYRSNVINFMQRLRLNMPLNESLIALDDTIKSATGVEETEMPFDFYDYFDGLDNWVKTEITNQALSSARNNNQNISLFQRSLYDEKKIINLHDMEAHRKFTLSFAVLVFFFIGVPLGAIIRKGGFGMPVVVSILLFIAYYIVSMMGEKSAREDVWGMFEGMWFSSFVFLPVGIWLTYKAATDSAIMTSEAYSKLMDRFKLGKLLANLRRKK